MKKELDVIGWRRRIGTLALEVLSVVLAVLLALAADDWRDARAAESLTRRSIASIAEEIDSNLQLVQEAHDHHQYVLEQIRDSYPEDSELSESDAQNILLDLYRVGVIRPGTVLDTAWSTAQMSGAIKGLEYEIALSLSKVYAVQADYRMATVSITNAMNLAQFLGAESSDYLSGIYEGVNSHWWHEERLMSAYQEALQKIGESGLIDSN